MRDRPHWTIRCLGMLCMVAGQRQGAQDGRPSSVAYLEQHCAAYAEDHHAIVDNWLRPYRAGIDAAHIVKFPHPEWWSPTPEGNARLPLVFNINGKLQLHNSISNSPKGPITPKNNFTGLGNFGFFHLPVIRAATAAARFDDFVLAHSPYAMPVVGHLQAPFPYVSLCNRRGMSTTMLIPADLKDAYFLPRMNASTSRAGPGDSRDRRAVFLGSPTGWENGRRHALCKAGALHPDHIYSGVTAQTAANTQLTLQEWEEFHKPKMSLKDQVDKFKMLIYTDGHCGALRQKDLLSGDSTVLVVQSSHELWHYPILVPWVHFIPVEYEPTYWTKQGGTNVHEAWGWAQHHQDKAGDIVQNAMRFSQLHFSEHGQLCYVVRLLHEYSKLLKNTGGLQDFYKYERRSNRSATP